MQAFPYWPQSLVIWCSHACHEHTHAVLNAHSVLLRHTSADSRPRSRALEVVSQMADGQQTNQVQTPAVFKPTKTSL